MTMFPRSIAVAKIRRGCPCAVRPSRLGQDGCISLTRWGEIRFAAAGIRLRRRDGGCPCVVKRCGPVRGERVNQTAQGTRRL
jgi:hypothetical protein